MERHGNCEICLAPFTYPARGRIRRFCSQACRQQNYMNKPEKRAMNRKWQLENKDRKQAWAAANRDKRNAAQRRYNATEAGQAAALRGRHARRARIAAAVPQRWRKSECPTDLCYWCGVDLSTVEVHLEHIMPISLGGPAVPSNEAPACSGCNLSKNDQHPLVWIAGQF